MEQEVRPGRVWLLFGARRVGKTVLVENFIVNERRRKLDYARSERRDYF